MFLWQVTNFIFCPLHFLVFKEFFWNYWRYKAAKIFPLVCEKKWVFLQLSSRKKMVIKNVYRRRAHEQHKYITIYFSHWNIIFGSSLEFIDFWIISRTKWKKNPKNSTKLVQFYFSKMKMRLKNFIHSNKYFTILFYSTIGKEQNGLPSLENNTE